MECLIYFAVGYAKIYLAHLSKFYFLQEKVKLFNYKKPPLRVFLYSDKIPLTTRGIGRFTTFLLLYMINRYSLSKSYSVICSIRWILASINTEPRSLPSTITELSLRIMRL